MRIRPVDVDSDDDLARQHEVYAAAEAYGRPYAAPHPFVEQAAWLRTPSSSSTTRMWVAEDAEVVLGVARLDLPLLDNLHLAEIKVHVRPDRWRRGIGTALVARLRSEAERADRRLATAWVSGSQLEPDGSPMDPEPSPGSAFSEACGLTERNTDVHRVLPLPVADELLDRLQAAAADHHRDYRLVSFTGPCPDEHVDAYSRLKAAMVAEAPMGDLDIEPEVWDERRLREEEDELAARRRSRSSVLALAADGEVAGFNELLHAEHEPTRLWNWDTLVLPAHRGHRLGMAVKVANLREAQRAHPEAREVHTHNAVQNGPMVAVNDALGFVPVEQVGEWQGDVTKLPGGTR